MPIPNEEGTYVDPHRHDPLTDSPPGVSPEVDDYPFRRSGGDVVMTLAANGRTVRLFTADGDPSSDPPTPRDVALDLGENLSDR